MKFELQHEAFSGPLDLLLNLIEKRKLFINDISLSKVTDDYLVHIKQFGDFPMADASDFIVIASTLILIKSKSLLPELPLTLEEQESIVDLEERLKLYQQAKALSIHIQKLFGKKPLFSKRYVRGSATIKVFAPAKDITLQNLADGITRILNSVPKKEDLPKISVKRVKSLEEVIVDLTIRIQKAISMSFKDFTKQAIKDLGESKRDKEHLKHEKVTVIVSFLAMLELVKQGMIEAKQQGDFGDILLENQHVGTPHY